MREKKNIDRIFQEKFKDFEVEPREKAWENIASRLDNKDRKKPFIIPLWFKVGGVAAVLGLILASILFTNTQQSITGEPEVVFENPEKSSKDERENTSEENDAVVHSEKKASSEEQNTASEESKLISGSNNKSESNSAIANNKVSKGLAGKEKSSKSSTQQVAVTENTTDNVNGEATRETGKESAVTLDDIKVENTPDANSTSKIAENDSKNNERSILEEENALAELQKKNEEEDETEIAETNSKKMRLSTFAAPVFYKNIGSGNELSNQLSNNETSSEVTFSYGVKIAYNLSDKFRIRTGISKIDINKNTQDISYSPSARAVGFENISPVEDNIEISSNYPSPSNSGLPINDGNFSNALTTAVVTPGEINQQFGYIEIPLELEYVLVDKKFGLNIIGGGSSLFLDNNRVQLVSGELKTELGEATNINSTSFSTNIGVGMNYEITDKFSINVEPIFKYQINTFDKVNNVQPINFGVYSGLSFSF